MKDKPSPYLIRHPIRDRKSTSHKVILKDLKRDLKIERATKRAEKIKEAAYN
jgi:hypothetical protein